MTNLAAGLFGVLLWPGLEYLLHRFLGHELPVRTKFKDEHLKHHRDKDYFSPAREKVKAIAPACAALFAAVWGVTGSAGAAAAFVGGFTASYLFYEWMHRHLHARPPVNRLGLLLRKHHFTHHLADARYNHGVTTPALDWVLGTLETSAVVRVPRSLAPDWMLTDGDIAPAYRADFALAGR